MKVNDRAVKKAKSLIEARQYVLESSWSDANPGSEETNEFLDEHGWDAYGEWHLAVDDEAGEETKERYKFPYGDFRPCTEAVSSPPSSAPHATITRRSRRRPTSC